MSAEFAFRLHLELKPEHRPTGKTRHYYGSPFSQEERVPVPPPSALEIVQYPDDDAYYLLYLDDSGNELTDTWHETINDAKAQAEFEFSVAPSEWPA